jgi:hypothetical protein
MPSVFGMPQAPSRDDEEQPIVTPISQKSAGYFWFGIIVASCSVAWCFLDSWNHELIGQLFGMKEILEPDIDAKTGAIVGPTHSFEYPLMLSFVQFGFMGLIFLAIFFCFASSPAEELLRAKDLFFGIGRRHAVGLVATHIFSTFWLQALIMPKQMMSLGIFAASRAIEIPAASILRSRIMSSRFGGQSFNTMALMFCAAWLLFYAYSQISQCLCVWSGYGVALTGPALWIIYALVLTVPVANSVCQEACMKQFDTHLVLMLAAMNLLACVAFIPILLLAHSLGWENVPEGVEMVMRHNEATMLVVWLCVQMCCISSVAAGLIYMLDSFWATALRSMRVVFWWLRQAVVFYFASGTLLSVAQPHRSFWSFVMISGLFLATGAVVSESFAKARLGKPPNSKTASEAYHAL